MMKIIKNNIIYILIGIILLLIVLSTYLVLNKYVISNSKDGKMECKKEYTRDFNVDNQNDKIYITDKTVVRYDKTGKIINIQNISDTKLPTDSYYKSLKQTLTSSKTVKYKFNDKKRIITQINDSERLKEEDGKEVELWYITYIESLESDGYICK